MATTRNAFLDSVFGKIGAFRANRRTKAGTFSEVDPASLLKDQSDNRDNTGWPCGQHVVVTGPVSQANLSLTLLNWANLTSKDAQQPSIQSLYIPCGGLNYQRYDAKGAPVGSPDTIDALIGVPAVMPQSSLDKYLAAIRTKPFVLLAGISGTGKSRLVRQLARGCCPELKGNAPHPLRDEKKPGNYELICVRPNWHDSTELMGYVTRITSSRAPKYILTPFVKFLVKAWLHKEVPFFLCLDEMNLAPVEQYFAEYLSVVETRKLVGGEICTDVLVGFDDEVRTEAIKELLDPYKPAAGSPIPQEVTDLENAMKADKGIRIPPNLVVMGTVNMDETTCSFSRKVLDRAMSFELNDVEGMYTVSTDGDPDISWGAFNNGSINRAKQTYVTAENMYAETDPVKLAANKAIGEKVIEFLKAVNKVLDKTPFKVAYRTRNEMMLYCVERGGDLAKALDEATSMKILSRVEGDENGMRITDKLVADAQVVANATANDAPKDLIKLLRLVVLKQLGVLDGTIASPTTIPQTSDYQALAGKYKVCAEKLDEMSDRLLSGYTGFWR